MSSKIEQIADEIGDAVFPPIKHCHASYKDDRSQSLAGMLMEFALEVKRASLEGEW